MASRYPQWALAGGEGNGKKIIKGAEGGKKTRWKTRVTAVGKKRELLRSERSFTSRGGREGGEGSVDACLLARRRNAGLRPELLFLTGGNDGRAAPGASQF